MDTSLKTWNGTTTYECPRCKRNGPILMRVLIKSCCITLRIYTHKTEHIAGRNNQRHCVRSKTWHQRRKLRRSWTRLTTCTLEDSRVQSGSVCHSTMIRGAKRKHDRRVISYPVAVPRDHTIWFTSHCPMKGLNRHAQRAGTH